MKMSIQFKQNVIIKPRQSKNKLRYSIVYISKWLGSLLKCSIVYCAEFEPR